MKTISENIRFLRKQRRLSQRELAEILGVSYKTVSKWETGAGLPDIQIIVPLSQALGVSTDAILKETPVSPVPAEKPLDQRQQLQTSLMRLQEEYQISVPQLLTTLGIKESELGELLMNSYVGNKGGVRQKKESLVKLLVILSELIPLYVENPHLLISSLYVRLQRDNDLCDETVEKYAGLKPGTMGKYLSGVQSLSAGQQLSLVITLYLLDRAFNPEDSFPRET